MTPGSVLHDPEFHFHDGEIGNKLFVILNDGTAGFYVAVRTTSQAKGKSRSEGCHLNDWQQNFFVPKAKSCFPKNTWICLDDFYEFKAEELLQGRFSGRISSVGELSSPIFQALIDCALHSDDISGLQAYAIQG